MIQAGSYNGILVLVSVLIGIFASYTALNLAHRVLASQGWARRLWLGAAAIAMGGGIWATHFVAMLAFSMPGMKVSYDLALTMLSLMVAVGTTGVAFVVIAHPKTSKLRLASAGVFMGLGVVAMHYLGMTAMQMPATILYDQNWVGVSILIAIGAATTALWLASRSGGQCEKMVAGVVMGSAIAGMHYAGMNAATFLAHSPAQGKDAQSVGQTSLALGIVAATVLILVFALLAALLDRRFAIVAQREAGAVLLSEERLRMLMMAETMAGVGHWHLNTVDQTLFWSDDVYRIYGRSLDRKPSLAEAVDAYHPEDREMVQHHIDTALQYGTPWSFRVRLIREDGAIRYVMAQGQIERASDDSIVGMFGVFQDVTAQALSEAAMIEARDAATAATRAKSAFLATMSHEIRTPMTGVLGMIELLKSNPPKEQQERFFDSLERSALLLMRVLDDVLDYSKMEEKAVVLEAIDFDFRELAQTTLDLFHHSVSEKGLLLAMSVQSGGSELARGDPLRIQQVISNLVSNAIKFTDVGRIDLNIVAKPAQDGCRLWTVDVIDTGIGIPAERITALFSPFVQVDDTTTRRFGGTGLGLAISRRLVDAMGGDIGITSTEGSGSRFRFVIELPDGAAVETIDRPSIEPAARALRVLLAEDNMINQLLISAILQKIGHDVVCVDNGRRAVEAVIASTFDVILMDMQMPELDGLAATRAIRASDSPSAQIPIIALTADASSERRRFYDNVGLSDFMTKPIDSQLLAHKLAAISRGEWIPAVGAGVAAADDDPIFDLVRLGGIEKEIGVANTNALLTLLEQEARARPTVIETLVRLRSFTVVASEAHDLRGAASNVGAVRLARAALAIELAKDDADGLNTAVSELFSAAAMTLDAIRRRKLKTDCV